MSARARRVPLIFYSPAQCQAREHVISPLTYCCRIAVDKAPVRASRGRTRRQPTLTRLRVFEAVKTASSVPLVIVPDTVKGGTPTPTVSE